MDFLDGAWDSAKGVFKDWIDFDNMRFEQQMAEDRFRWEREQARNDAPDTSSWSPVSTSGSSIDGKTLLIGGAVIIGGFLVAKQFKLI